MAAAGDTGVPMAFGVLTTDTEAQAQRARRPGRRQQGARSGRGRDRDGGAVPPARPSASTAGGAPVRIHGGQRSMNAGDAQAKRRAREAALQMLYQCEVGRAGAVESIASYWPARDADGAAAGTAARVRQRAGARHAWIAVEEIDALLAAHAQNWRVERMAVIDRLVLRMAVYEMLAEPETPAQGDHQRGDRAGAQLQRRRSGRLRQRRAGAVRKELAALVSQALRPSRRRTVDGQWIDRTCPKKTRESDQLRQRRANFEELIRLGVDPYPRTFERTDTIDALVDAHGGKTGEELEAAPVTTTDGRAHPGDPQLRQGELPGHLRRPSHASRSTSGRTRCPSATSRSTSCSTSATSSASRDSCSAPRPTS